ncbi:hypothetical protein [Pleurocapsa sp. PCC 7319]|uniref:hypothetical protein n=1 Tax=Pleurocapsa sp. PCC 7319 TaxID=118161 RepID=UPI00034B5532|nr:hypothetical protein [Pleurocapsa sp. PCC 7319]
MKISTLPFLLATVLGFITIITRRAVKLGYIQPQNAKNVYYLLGVLGLWTVVSSILAIKGFYASPRFWALLPGLWFPFVPVSFCLIPFAISSQFRDSLIKILNATPIYWLVYLQGLRIAALGTLYKTIIGQFPVHVELIIGISDLIFGCSAFYIAKRVRANTIGWRSLAIWNLVGAGIIIIPGEIAIQMGLPGFLQMFNSPPTAEVMFEFPLVIAPTIIVPLLVLMNGLVAWWLFKTQPVSLRGKKGKIMLRSPI